MKTEFFMAVSLLAVLVDGKKSEGKGYGKK